MQRNRNNHFNPNKKKEDAKFLPETEEEIEEDLSEIAQEIEEQTIFTKQDDKIHSTFRDFYIRELTTHFGNDLDIMRRNETDFNQQKLNLLVEFLNGGCNLFSTVEKELIMSEQNKPKKAAESPHSNKLTIL